MFFLSDEIVFFKSDELTYAKQDNTRGNSYIETYNGNFFLVSANGLIAYENMNKILSKDLYENLKNENFSKIKLKLIETNLDKEIIYSKGKKEFFSSSKKGIKDVFIENDKIYLSFTNELKKGCFNTSILVANLNSELLNFKKFFEPAECIDISKLDNFLGTENIDLLFNSHQGGGRIVSDGKNHLYFTVGDYRVRDNAQNINSIFGKILKINKNNGNWKVGSSGRWCGTYIIWRDDCFVYSSCSEKC